MQRWLRSLVDTIAARERVNPPIEAALELQVALKAQGRENAVTEDEMREAFAELGLTDEDAVDDALENFASWQ